MVTFSLKVLAKFDHCSNRSQKLHECLLTCARQIFTTAHKLRFSLILLCQPVTVLVGLYVLMGKRMKLHNKRFIYWFIFFPYFIVAGLLLEITILQ